MAKQAAISFRIDSDIKAALERAAQADRRTLASLATIILEDWAVANGYMGAGAAGASGAAGAQFKAPDSQKKKRD